MNKKKIRKLGLAFFLFIIAIGCYYAGTKNYLGFLFPKPTSPAFSSKITQQIFSPDKKRQIMIKEDSYMGYQHIILADSNGGDQKTILKQMRYLYKPIAEDNWSENSQYLFIQVGGSAGDDLYIFKANGESFPGDKEYLDAFDLGLPKNQVVERASFHLGGGGGYILDPLDPTVITVSIYPRLSPNNLYIYPTLGKSSKEIHMETLQ